MSSSGEVASECRSKPTASSQGLLPQSFTFRQCINLHKLLIFPIYVYILYAHNDGGNPFDLSGKSYGPSALMILVGQSLYGLMWVFKDVHFGDPSWLKPLRPISFVLTFIYPLAMYYLPMFCLVSEQCPGGTFGSGSEPWVVGYGLFCYIIGVFYHFGSDCQKYYCLKHQRPRSLITDGFFSHCRNPNYFGETIMYFGFGIWSCNYIVIPLFSTVWLFLFIPNMRAKEASMSRYPQWKAWHDRTGFFFPWLPSLFYDLYVKGLGSGLDTNKLE